MSHWFLASLQDYRVSKVRNQQEAELASAELDGITSQKVVVLFIVTDVRTSNRATTLLCVLKLEYRSQIIKI
jgi:hypothetical protein